MKLINVIYIYIYVYIKYVDIYILLSMIKMYHRIQKPMRKSIDKKYRKDRVHKSEKRKKYIVVAFHGIGRWRGPFYIFREYCKIYYFIAIEKGFCESK